MPIGGVSPFVVASLDGPENKDDFKIGIAQRIAHYSAKAALWPGMKIFCFVVSTKYHRTTKNRWRSLILICTNELICIIKNLRRELQPPHPFLPLNPPLNTHTFCKL